MGNYSHTTSDKWHWSRMIHTDVEDVLNLTDQYFTSEINEIFQPNRTRLAYNLHDAILKQSYGFTTHFINVAREQDTKRLLAWSWLERGKYMAFSNNEMAVAEFVHMDMTIPVRQRMRLTAQIIEQWIAWCEIAKISILASTSIRADQEGFMRLHEQFGFMRRGSFAYRRIGD